MEKARIVIIGAGAVGLAVAAKLSEDFSDIYVLEKNNSRGQETSGHNSGVIHSGIHYPPHTLKAELCVKGNKMTYDICRKNGIPHKRLGKLTVAVQEEETEELKKLMEQGNANGAEDLKMLNAEEVKALEPNVQVEMALHSPSTGIVEPDELMDHYLAVANRNGAVLATQTEVKRIQHLNDEYIVNGSSVNESFSINAGCVVNCAGLHSDMVASMAGLDVNKLGYRLHLCKGDYYRVSGKPLVTTLVYPVPKGAGLGIHLTPDMKGSVRLGPNAYYVDKISYEVESSEKEFREDVERFVPNVSYHEIRVDSAGVRPKLQGPKDGFKDFVIRHEKDHGLFGFINLVGIESPGLTAAPAIAERVSMIYELEIKR